MKRASIRFPAHIFEFRFRRENYLKKLPLLRNGTQWNFPKLKISGFQLKTHKNLRFTDIGSNDKGANNRRSNDKR